MKCPACQNPATPSLHGNVLAGRQNTRYVVHPEYGMPLRVCAACGFVFAEVLHPAIVDGFRKRLVQRKPAAFHRAASPQDLVGRVETPAATRLLLFAPPLGGVHRDAQALADEVVVADPAPPPLAAEDALPCLNAMALTEARWRGHFDAVVLAGGFTDHPLPRFWLDLLSMALRPDGALHLAVRAYPRDAVENGNYAVGSIQFYTSPAFAALAGKSAHFRLERAPAQAGGAMTATLVNVAPRTEPPRADIDPQDIAEAIKTASLSCMMLSLHRKQQMGG